jgi:hypothetical protein
MDEHYVAATGCVWGRRAGLGYMSFMNGRAVLKKETGAFIVL